MGSLKFFDLAELKSRHGAATFVETGAGWGHGIEYAQTFDFEKIWSVEIFTELAQALSQKFASDPRVRLVNSDSVTGLEHVYAQTPGNTITFLDAHFPGADVGAADFGAEQNEDIRLPLLTEMAAVKRLRADKGFKDIILLDDIMLYDDENSYPGNSWKTALDIMPRKNRNCYREILHFFDETHTSQIFNQENGFVIFSPKP